MSDRPRTRETRQRQLVLEFVREATSHPTADWIFEQVKELVPKISLGTVYRNLAVLKEEGLIREIHGIERKAHYESTEDPHGHFICSGCGEIRDVHAMPPLPWHTFKELVGCEVDEQRIEFVGTCAACTRHRPAAT